MCRSSVEASGRPVPPDFDVPAPDERIISALVGDGEMMCLPTASYIVGEVHGGISGGQSLCG
jgi:hypothetical protein